MDYLTVALIVVAFYGLYYYLTRNLDYFDKRGIPCLPAWPLFGNMFRPIFRLQHVYDLVHDVYNVNQEAKYVGAFDFTRPVIVLRDLELIKNAMIKNFDHFADHRGVFDDTIDPLYAGNLFSLKGNKWKELRNLLTPTFTSSKMKMMYELMVECGKNFVEYVKEQPAEANKMVDTKDLFSKYTNDVIATCAFGLEVNSLKDPKNRFYVYGKDLAAFNGMRVLKFYLVTTTPRLCKAFNIKSVNDEISQFFYGVVSDAIATRDEKGIRRPDMLQLLMDARTKETENLKMDLQAITAQAFIFFLAGFDGTARMMSLICHLLAINPDIQKRLQDEIDGVGENPTYEAIRDMAYLDAIFNETMRRYSLAGFLDRQCTKNFELPPALPGGKPYIVQEGTGVWIPASTIHMDPNYYENPEKFDPERYMNKKVTINDVTNLGFGIGPRSCIGNRFAILEIKVVLFFLLAKFSVRPNENTCNPLRYSKKEYTLVPEGGFWLAFEPRF